MVYIHSFHNWISVLEYVLRSSTSLSPTEAGRECLVQLEKIIFAFTNKYLHIYIYISIYSQLLNTYKKIKKVFVKMGIQTIMTTDIKPDLRGSRQVISSGHFITQLFIDNFSRDNHHYNNSSSDNGYLGYHNCLNILKNLRI